MKPIRVAILLLLAVPAFAEKEPPTPAERVEKLRKKWAEEHARLASWASGKKLGRAARDHYFLAIRLKPDCRRARTKLGHRKAKDGTWDTSRAKKFEDGRGAGEKWRTDFVSKEGDLVEKECAAFEKLGLALVAEVETSLGHPLLLRACLLLPGREKAAEAVGLANMGKGLARAEVVKSVRAVPSPADAGIPGVIGSVLGIRTVVRRCGSAVAEVPSDKGAADRLARAGHQAQLLTSLNNGLPPLGVGWIDISVANGAEQFRQFLDGTGLPDSEKAACLQIGSSRGFAPRHYVASWRDGGGDAAALAPLFVHCAAEDALFWRTGQRCPAWFHEAVGIDACLLICRKPGTPCAVLEESAGLLIKEAFTEPARWGVILARMLARRERPLLPELLRTQLQALGPEDLIAGHALYRYLTITAPESLPLYVTEIAGAGSPDPEETFAKVFGPVADLETRWRNALLAGR